MAKYMLLTGGTGLVGRFLMWDLLERDHPLAVLIRAGRGQTARERLEAVLQVQERRTGRLLPRPVCLEGDVSREGLGLRSSEARWVARHCQRVLHNAAVLTFFGTSPESDPWKTNVGGTRHVLEACRRWRLRDLHYVSTAYVCGTRAGVIGEHELDCGQTFRNDYEHSKFLAEKMVRQAAQLDRVTVYRPVVIGGDSISGYTNTYHGVYVYLKLMSVLVSHVQPDADGRRHTPVRLEMRGDEHRNVVPVDWVSAVICRLLATPSAQGGTYHLAPRDPLTPRQVIEAGYAYFNAYGVQFCGPQGGLADLAGRMDQDARQNMAVYRPYETTDPVFDTANLRQFTGDLPCPRIDAPMLHRFWRYAEEDRWGKRRSLRPLAVRPVAEFLQQQVQEGRASAPSPRSLGTCRSERPAAINLEVLGPGGGQWHCCLRGERLVRITAGRQDGASATLRLAADAWRQLQRGDPQDGARHVLGNLKFHQAAPAGAGLARTLFAALFGSGATAAAGQNS